MTNDLVQRIESIAEQVRSVLLSRYGVTKGHCKEASLAFALRIAELDESICICQGKVKTIDGEYDHYWNTFREFIIDLTADQFNLVDGLLIWEQKDFPHYDEYSFIVFTPSLVLDLYSQSISSN